ncbi:MAG: Uma2 family endonuclease [Tannerella sp.]|jgi:Uma2 family endonuclease|nr:Uma2 family endonuclease [Tannerella sp.]
MELSLDFNKQYSYADYLTWIDDKRRELINGFVRMMLPAPTKAHASVSGNIVYEMQYYSRLHGGPCQVFYAPFDVRLPKNGEREDDKLYNVVQPDICVVCDPNKLDERGCLGAPDLIVEILSKSNRQYDLHDKYMLYEKSGVQEYWVVEPKYKDVTVYLLGEDGKYAEGKYYEGKALIPVHVLPGLELDTEDIFKGV